MSDTLENLRIALAERYVLEREIGAGGMATVYLARDVRHARHVAIKVLQPELSAVVGAKRFLNEIRVTANLQHPHILPLYDSGEAAGFLYYVMPFAEGESLRERMNREGQLPVEEAAEIARKVASALEVAHRQGIVHRDIKPENILLISGEPMVADFGIARAVSLSGGQQLTGTGVAIGTPAYMSLEQSGGEEVDARTDIYALGTVLYEMLAGERPYTGSSVHAVIAKRLHDPVPSVRRLRETVPAELDRVIRRALAKAPVDRFASASEFGSAIATPAPFSAHPSSAISSHRPSKWWWGVAAAVGLAAIGGTWMVLGRNGTVPAPGTSTQIAVLPFTARGGDDVSYLGEGMVNLLSAKLDGAGEWRTVDPRAVLASVKQRGSAVLDPAVGREVATTLSANLYVLGDIVEVGSTVRLDASLYDRDADAAPVSQASAEGPATDVLRLVDQLAAQLLVGRSGATGERLTRIAAVTTSSLPALKAYLRGTREMWNGQFAEAGESLQEAVREDSTFALAWYQLSVAADWMLRADIAREAGEQAVRYADRLSERDRRLLTALRTVRTGKALEAERLYRAIISTYPRDVEAWYQLGEVLFHFGPRMGRALAESREPLQRLVTLDPTQATARIHLARLAATERDYTELDSLAEQVAGLSAESRVPVEVRMLQVLGRGDSATRALLVEELRQQREAVLPELAWAAGSFSGSLEGTRQVASLLVEPTRSSEARSTGHLLLAQLALAGGRWSDAQRELDAAAQIDAAAAAEHRALLLSVPFVTPSADQLEDARTDLVTLPEPPPAASPLVWYSVHNDLHPALRAYLAGRLSLRLGDGEAARRYLRELESLQLPEGSSTLGRDLAVGLRAGVSVMAGDTGRAAALLDDLRLETWHQLNVASPFYSLGLERFLRARALQFTGSEDEALRWFGTFAHTTPLDLVYLAPSHFYRGEILEGRGERDAALAHYTRFLELWAESDSAFQGMVDDARNRVARLGAHP